MTTKEARSKSDRRLRGREQAWRRCGICGRFIPYEDFEDGKTVSYDPTGVGDLEPRDPVFSHAKCAEKEMHKA